MKPMTISPNHLARRYSIASVTAALLICFGLCTLPAAAQAVSPGSLALEPANAALQVRNGQFYLNGKPYQVLAGEIHYARVPREYWRARLRLIKAMGLNTVSTYVFWNAHEPKPGVYDFSGNNDVAEFVREAQQEGLNVILRPGPYACAEWELGGYPAWLIANPKMVLRSNDPVFMKPAKQWMLRLGKELAPLTADRGGPIIAVQLENEYGSFGDDHVYLAHLRQILLKAGFGGIFMYTADGADRVKKGNLPGLLAVETGGVGGSKDSFELLKAYEPGLPQMSGEYWNGWYDQWGRPHNVRDPKAIADEYRWMIDNGHGVNFYMVHGGTSFGWMNGANIDKGDYHPVVTSYDYDAPIDESGRPTSLYFTLRNILSQHLKAIDAPLPPPVPVSPPTMNIAPFTLTESVSLWKALPKPVKKAEPVTMEDLGQSYGYILYRTTIAKPVDGPLQFALMHDYAQIYLNGKLAGTMDRRLHQSSLTIHVTKPNTQLDVLVENTGRVNFGPHIREEWQGLRGPATLAGAPVKGWKIYTLPMTSPESLSYTKDTVQSGPVFYRGSFNLTKTDDTFLDMGGWAKGQVWINGHNLGRFWKIGPQQTLYLPGPWLKKGQNTVVIFDLTPQPGQTLQALDKPILDAPVKSE